MPGLGILVGPGVIRAGAVDALQAFAAVARCGVVNTWGAKGVFRWDDPHHFGTAGLQARDFELAGLADVDVLVVSGLDDDEVTRRPWEGRAEVLSIEPSALTTAAADLHLPDGTLDRPALYTELAAVVGPLYESIAVPPPAAQLARGVAAMLAPDSLVVAEPGIVGFWVARTFPTTAPGSVVVPATGGREAAWRAASTAVDAGRAVVLVAHEVPPPGAVPPQVEVQVWDDASADLDASALITVAGPIVAWGGLDA